MTAETTGTATVHPVLAEHQATTQVKRHWLFVDVLNVIACIAVVCLHTSLGAFHPEQTMLWKRQVAMQSLFIFATPIFFMISGMNLLGYRQKYDTATFFKKRAWRTGRALIVGSVVCYLVFGLFPSSFYGTDAISADFGIIGFAKHFLTNSINDIYWFFYSILYLYMLTPLLSKCTERKTMQYLIGLTGFVAVVLPLLEHFGVPSKYFGQLFGWPLFASVSLLYFALGYYLNNYVIPVVKPHPWMASIAFLLSSTAMFFATLLNNGWRSAAGLSSEYINYWSGTTSPLAVIQAISLFLLFAWLEPRLQHTPASFSKVIRILSSASLGVYLFHILLVNQLLVIPVLPNLPLLRGLLYYAITAIFVLAVKQLIMKIEEQLHSNTR